MEIPQRTKNRTTTQCSSSTPGYLSKENKHIRKDICIPMFTAALFTIVKIRKPLKCPPTDEWIKMYIYTKEY